MQLSKYLDRVGFTGTPEPDIDTLFEMHRRHLFSIPYENLDVQLGNHVDLDIERIFDKIVLGGRGGWCYEMNGIFSWALAEVGFDVVRMGGAVGREFSGNDDFFGSHLVLSVAVDGQDWLCDVGFGDGFIEPIPLDVGEVEQRGFTFGLAKVESHWRLHSHQFGAAPSYDFAHEPVDVELLQSTCDWLKSAPESPFIQWLVVQRFVDGGYQLQKNLIASHVTPVGVTEWTINSADELMKRLRDDFSLDVPEVESLWPTLLSRHEEHLAREADKDPT